ncbi:hypothetical protein MRX96_010436 [Rhipicephalus microplus]
MTGRRVKQTRFKTASYQHPESQHQENQTRRTVALGGGIANISSKTTFSPGTHANRRNSRATVLGDWRGVEGFQGPHSRGLYLAQATAPSALKTTNT